MVATTVANGTAVVVCPGGGYGSVGIDEGGVDIMEWLKPIGVTGQIPRRVSYRWEGLQGMII